MTLNELLKWCDERGVSPDTQIAMRADDDYFLTDAAVSLSKTPPYFGNSQAGEDWIKNNVPRDVDDEIDYDQCPPFIILDTGR